MCHNDPGPQYPVSSICSPCLHEALAKSFFSDILKHTLKSHFEAVALQVTFELCPNWNEPVDVTYTEAPPHQFMSSDGALDQPSTALVLSTVLHPRVTCIRSRLNESPVYRTLLLDLSLMWSWRVRGGGRRPADLRDAGIRAAAATPTLAWLPAPDTAVPVPQVKLFLTAK